MAICLNTIYLEAKLVELGDEVTWSDITAIQLECVAFRSDDFIIQLKYFVFWSNTVGI